MRKIASFLGLTILLGVVALAVAQNNPAGSGPCDRACLEGFVDRYLDAVIAHDPKRLPLAPNAKFTENGQRLNPGDGFWRSTISKGNYRLFVTDVEAGQVAFIGTITEGATPRPGEAARGAAAPAPARGGARGGGGGGTGGGPSALALRLKIVNRQITEMENLIVRNAGASQNIEAAGMPHPLYTQAVPPSERMSRADLVRVSNMYFSGMQQNDGKGDYPFADDCDRFENGAKTTNNG